MQDYEDCVEVNQKFKLNKNIQGIDLLMQGKPKLKKTRQVIIKGMVTT